MKFLARDFSLDDAPRSGRPVKVDSDQIKTLIENSQHYAMWEIANILKISKSIKLLMKMKNVSFMEKNTNSLANPIFLAMSLWPYLPQYAQSRLIFETQYV